MYKVDNMYSNRQRHIAFAGDLYDESVQYGNIKDREREGSVWSANEDDISLGRIDDDDESLQDVPKKRVKIRVPVVRSRSARQHKLTIVRRRPLSSHTQDLTFVTPTEHAPRRIVVTRVRTLESDKLIYPTDTLDPIDYQSSVGKHKVTITRRRKLQSTSTSKSIKDKVRVTRKKLVAVRPILPTPAVAIITTGFFTAPSFEYDDEYSDEENEDEHTTVKEEDHIVITPSLEETPNLIDNKPGEETNLASLEASLTVSKESMLDAPVIITDNFFFPPSDDEKDDEYDDDYFDVATTTENVDNILIKDEQHPTTEIISAKDENNVVSNKSDVETKQDDMIISISQITSENSSQEQSVIQESNNASINITEFIDTSLENDYTAKTSKTIVLKNEDIPTTEFIPTEKDNDDNFATKEYTTTVNPEEQTTFIDDVTSLNVPESIESTSLSDDEDTTNIPNTTEVHGVSITEVMLDTKEENQESSEDTGRDIIPEMISEIPEELLTVRPIQSDVKTDSNSTQISLVETIFLSNVTFDSVIPLATMKLSTNSSDSYIPSVIPLSANYASETKSSIRKTSVLDTIPVTKVTTKIASPTPEEIEAGLTDDLYLSLSRLDFPEILPSKPATIGLETKSTPDLMLEPSTSVYYTETVVTSTRLRTYTYVVTQQNGQETKVTSSTTVRPRVTTLTLTVPVTVTVTPTVESSADFVSSVYNPVSVAGE